MDGVIYKVTNLTDPELFLTKLSEAVRHLKFHIEPINWNKDTAFFGVKRETIRKNCAKWGFSNGKPNIPGKYVAYGAYADMVEKYITGQMGLLDYSNKFSHKVNDWQQSNVKLGEVGEVPVNDYELHKEEFTYLWDQFHRVCNAYKLGGQFLHTFYQEKSPIVVIAPGIRVKLKYLEELESVD